MNGVNLDGDELFSPLPGYYSTLSISISVNVRRTVICTFTSNVGEIFHILVPSSKHFCSCCHHFLKLGVVHVHQSLRTEDFEKLVIEV